jgi:hypothetical protein
MSRKTIIDPNAVAALSKLTPSTAQAKTRGRPDLPFVRGTVFIPRGTYARLKALAASRQTSVQGLFEEAMDAWLAAQGEPPFFPEGWKGWSAEGPKAEDS